ncbi:2-dehydropantoate 2-reductase [Corynebacterium sp. ED61]|uniref:2-dehydropantoate 2-reductase n=1 Tax=Corynebacterium sp. ED61 TaxID=2211360 RepID=UPI0018832BC5|nr:2-dehydropantoate 2-reductase [Corynebacterium sp. ED61]MBF0580760.1 2-dehydropantoate 2-reductase [Corynebacterium sp. ED61]
MKIGFLGAGAVGGYFGGLMAQAGQDVGFVARGETLEVLRSTGLTLIDPDDNTTTVPATSAESFSELREALGGLDVVIVATKALPGNETFPDVEGVPVVTTHNSVEVPYLAAERFGENNVLPGVIRGYLTHLGPAKIKLHPGPLSLNVGTFAGDSASAGDRAAAVARELTEHLHAAEIGGKCLDDIFVDVWSKALFVTTTGELGALANQPLGYLRTELRGSLEQLMREVEAVARGNDVALPENIVEKTLGFVDQQISEATSSMQRDITAGKPNELDAQVGAIIRMGQKAGVETPLHDLVYGALQGRLAATS